MELIIIDYNPLPIHKLSEGQIETLKILNKEFDKIKKHFLFKII